LGHNDEKTDSGVTTDDFKTHLATYAAEVKALGGKPILVTPLIRRTLSGDPPTVIPNL